MIRGINKGKINSRFPAAAVYTAGIAVKLNSSSQWEAAAQESQFQGILMQDVIAKPSAYYGTSGTVGAGSFQVIVDDITYLGDKVRVCYGPGEYETDQIYTGVSPAVGDLLYVNTAGKFTNTATAAGATIGRWDSAKDSSGKAKFSII